AFNRHDIPAPQVGIEGLLGAPTRSHPARLAYNKTFNPRPRRLFILTVDTVVADQRIGHADDLSGVGRIGQHFLVTSHRGIEDHFAGALAFRSPRATTKDAAVFESKESGFLGSNWHLLICSNASDYCPLPTALCLLPTAYRLLPTVLYEL